MARYTKVTQHSWSSRLGESFKGIIIGIIFVVASVALLFWNEGRAVNRHRSLQEAGQAVISVSPESIDEANSGKLIHVTGKADTDAVLTDSVFGISENAIRLHRNVEMYQWQERSQTTERRKTGGGSERVTEYTYSRTWSDEVINSADFEKYDEHQNPGSFPYESTRQVADNVTLGAFTLSRSLTWNVPTADLPVEPDTPVPNGISENIQIHDNAFYLGNDPFNPEIGDTRIKFEIARPQQVSIMARQINGTFEPHTTQAGGTIELLHAGNVSAQAMLEHEEFVNKILTWFLRVLGFAFIFGGFALIARPLGTLADVLPILGDIVRTGTFTLSLLASLTLSLITIAIAWLFYRPVLAIVLIAISIGVAMIIKTKLKAAKAEQPGIETETG